MAITREDLRRDHPNWDANRIEAELQRIREAAATTVPPIPVPAAPPQTIYPAAPPPTDLSYQRGQFGTQPSPTGPIPIPRPSPAAAAVEEPEEEPEEEGDTIPGWSWRGGGPDPLPVARDYGSPGDTLAGGSRRGPNVATMEQLLAEAYGAPIPRDAYGNPIITAGPLPAPIIQGPTQPPRPGTGQPPPGGGTTTPPPGGGGQGRGGQDWAGRFATRFGNVAGATYNPALNWGRNVSAAVHLRNDARRGEQGGVGDPAAAVNEMVGNVFTPGGGGGNAFTGGPPPQAIGGPGVVPGITPGGRPPWVRGGAPPTPAPVANLQKVAPRFMHAMQGLQRLKRARGY